MPPFHPPPVARRGHPMLSSVPVRPGRERTLRRCAVVLVTAPARCCRLPLGGLGSRGVAGRGNARRKRGRDLDFLRGCPGVTGDFWDNEATTSGAATVAPGEYLLSAN